MAQQMTLTARNRFRNKDILELQEINRRPISDYRHVPTMSLEEAVEGIVPFISDVKSCANVAKERCTQNTTLTINESAAIYLYTKYKHIFEKLNKTLRAENPYALEPWFPYLKLFLTAVGKLPSRLTTVWRGVGSNIGRGFERNVVHTWWSMNSCSSYLNVAGIFAGDTGTLFCINALHGKDISAYSAYPQEEEIVLMPGTCLRVKGMLTESNGRSIVHLDEW